jgi:Uma2 family endonuclease
MATNPRKEQTQPMWHRPGTRMTEQAYHELERLSPECRYEYIEGLASVMSGGSVAHDRIAYNPRLALDLQIGSRLCTVFGADVQVFLALKNVNPHFVYPDATVSCNAADSQSENTLIESPRVVIEVLSPGTETKDRGTKFKACQNVAVCSFSWSLPSVCRLSAHFQVSSRIRDFCCAVQLLVWR